MKSFLLSAVIVIAGIGGFTQNLQPGFDAGEFREMLYINSRFARDSSFYKDVPAPQAKLIYDSPVTGLENKWRLWYDGTENRAIIAIRGTTQSSNSWLLNLHAAMLPASGSMVLPDGYSQHYSLADDPRAGVHAGWLVACAFLIRDIRPRLDSIYASGVRDIIITGHSQGGAISYLLTSWLRSDQSEGRIPRDMRIKTYGSAAPKPGNLYYAYAYEALTQEGWSYNVVNASDWVPECPVTIQKASDFNATSPFAQSGDLFRRASLPARIVLKSMYRRMEKPLDKAQRAHLKYLGKKAGKRVLSELEGLQLPDYLPSSNYSRAGNYYVLVPDAAYKSRYPEDPTALFRHHLTGAYIFLMDSLQAEDELPSE